MKYAFEHNLSMYLTKQIHLQVSKVNGVRKYIAGVLLRVIWII